MGMKPLRKANYETEIAASRLPAVVEVWTGS